MPVTSINNSGTLYVTGSLDEVSLGTGSVRFNGTSTYLNTTVGKSIFSLGTGDFTVEAWIYVTYPFGTAGQGRASIVSNRTVAASNTSFDLQHYNGRIYFGTVSTDIIVGGTTLSINTWYHVAATRSSGTVYLFLNGVSDAAPVTGNTTNFSDTSTVYIGCDGSYLVPLYPFTGYISNLRIVNGTALYTNNFVPPTGPFTPVYNTVLLLNKNSITDSSVYNSTVTNTNSAISTAFNPFYIDYSLGSLSLNGTSQYLTVAGSAAFAFGTGDFTAELWAYPTSATWTTGNFYFWDINSPSVTLQYYQDQLRYYNTTIGVGSSLYASGKTLPLNTWSHLAIARQSGTTRMFVNGILITSAADSYNAGQSGTVYFGTSSGGNPFPGYISNLRIVKGAAVYTGNFTPSPRPLVNTAGTLTSILLNTSAVSAASVILDSSLNNYSVTPVGSPVNSINNPFINYNATTTPNTVQRLANTDNIQSGLQTLGEIDEVTMVQGSLQFNGSTAVLTSAAATAVTFGTSNFTVECWVYLPAYVTSDANEKDIIEGNPSAGSFQLYITGSGQGLRWGTNGVTGNTIIAAASIPVGRWFHIAVSRAGTGASQTFAFIDGVLVLTVTDSNNYSGTGLGIGGRNTGANYLNGYISNLRCVNGTALYTQNFTPSKRPLEQVPNTRLLLTTPYTGQYITDFSTSSVVLTNVGGVASASLSPFATIGSLRFNGSNQYLSITGATSGPLDLATGAPDWTVECWFYPNSVTGQQSIFWKGGTTGSVNPSYAFFLSGTGGQWLIGDGGAGAPAIQNVTFTFAIGTWYHFALVRNSTTMTAYINGVAQTPVTIVGTMSNTGNNGFNIANSAVDGSSRPFNGYITNFRIVKGTAIYTGAFVTPTQPLTAFGTQTSLLLSTPNSLDAFKDFSSNNFTATNVSNTTSTIFNPFLNNLSNPPTRANTVQRVNSQGLQVSGSFDEFSLNRGSTFFNGSSQYLTVTGSGLTLPTTTTPFTVEAWVNVNAFTGTAVISSVITSNVEFAMGFTLASSSTDPDTPGAYLYVGRFSPWTILVSPTPAVVNTWYHIATSFDGTTTRLFLNGALVKSGSIAWTTSAIGSLYIGRRWDAFTSIYYSGYISNVRFVKGAALYTAAFSPPTQPLTLGVYNTQTSLLLNTVAFPALNQKDSSTNNCLVTPTGSPPPSELNPFN